jgi:hypothetical protein
MGFPGRGMVLRLGLLVAVGWAANVGWAQTPPNDNFSAAWAFTTGITNGSNVGATPQPGEPDPFLVSSGESVWYSWTAPADGSYAFSTEGSAFDALVGVYTGNAVNALTFVSEGFAVMSFIPPVSSPASFLATAGTLYHIQVNGWAFGIPDGSFVLTLMTNSLPSSAGDFLFASQATVPGSTMPLYIASESESNTPLDPRGDMRATAGARLTVTRLVGSTGKVLVDYDVTNTFYTNYYTTNIWGTNLFLTNLTAGTFTNLLQTNTLVTAEYQNNEYGVWLYITNYTFSELNGSTSPITLRG